MLRGVVRQAPYTTDLQWNHKASADTVPSIKTCALVLLTGCEDWLVQPYKTEREHLNIEKLTALICYIMPTHHLVWKYEICD